MQHCKHCHSRCGALGQHSTTTSCMQLLYNDSCHVRLQQHRHLLCHLQVLSQCNAWRRTAAAAAPAADTTCSCKSKHVLSLCSLGWLIPSKMVTGPTCNIKHQSTATLSCTLILLVSSCVCCPVCSVRRSCAARLTVAAQWPGSSTRCGGRGPC
jgi:hypothetical protein